LKSEQDTNSPIRRKPVATGKGRARPSTPPLATENEPDGEPLLWTFEQAFFAVMGGFAVENDYLNESNVKVTIRRILTIDGVLLLAKFGLLPHIDPEAISERSKADNIAKLLVLSQITWFGLQVIGRLVSKIPVTPLELHTVIHVACAIVMYVLWMNKPYDLRGSILLTDPDTKAVAALCNFEKSRAKLHTKSCMDYQIARERYWKDRVVRASNNLLDHNPPPIPPSPPLKEELTKAVRRFSTDQEVPRPLSKDSEEHMLEALAASARQGVAVLKRRGGYSDHSINERSWDLLRENSENFTMKAVWGGWSTNTGHKMSIDKGVHFLFNFLYGGVHLSAWASSSFPTFTERVLWIAAAFMLTCIPLFGAIWILWWRAVSSKRRWLYLVRNGDLDILAAPFFFVLMLAYFFSRCYFLVESLISLRLLPPGAYLTVNWVRYLPHIS